MVFCASSASHSNTTETEGTLLNVEKTIGRVITLRFYCANAAALRFGISERRKRVFKTNTYTPGDQGTCKYFTKSSKPHVMQQLNLNVTFDHVTRKKKNKKNFVDCFTVTA